ncbi:MAG: amine oxidase, partial [Candidatus Zixiibacteriota bacterium]
SERSLLVLYAQGEAAQPFLGLPEKDRLDRASALAEQLFPGITESCEVAVSYCWDDDPWARGAQSRVPLMPGQPLADIIRPDGRLHFAGEHACSLASLGWMNGALESGHRVAAEITG